MAEINLRKPAVAGQFYPLSAKELSTQINSLIDRHARKYNTVACVLPHAGYIYSGEVAGKTLSCVDIREKIILLGPNHTGYGVPFSIMTKGIWQTPLGEIKIDGGLAEKILEGCRYLKDDYQAHTYEHSLEVELPLLQSLKGSFEIVPIIFASDDLFILKEIGKSIAKTINSLKIKDSVTIIASSDMTHYESQDEAQRKDRQAIKAIVELNENGLMQKIKELNISMCGYAPVIAMLAAAKMLGAKEARLIKYQTSGDVTGDKNSVVGYAGITVY